MESRNSNPSKEDFMIVPRAAYKSWCELLLEQSAPNTADSKFTDEANDVPILSNPVKRTASISCLPPELLIEIFGHLSSHQSALYASSLVCRQWLTCAVPILYRRPIVLDTYRWAIFILTLTRTKRSFQYGHLITSVDLSSGKSIEVMKDHEFYLRVTGLVHGNNTPRITPSPIPNMSHVMRGPAGIFRLSESLAREDNGAMSFRGLSSIIISTSSLIQLAHNCNNLTSLNLSYTSMLTDSMIEETGEYLSTLQYYAIQPGLTHVQISLETAIKAIGRECKHIEELKAQRCEWISAQVIWMWATYCPSLVRIDARRSTKCTVKRLVSSVLEIHGVGKSRNNNHHNTGRNSHLDSDDDRTMTTEFLAEPIDGVNHVIIQTINGVEVEMGEEEVDEDDEDEEDDEDDDEDDEDDDDEDDEDDDNDDNQGGNNINEPAMLPGQAQRIRAARMNIAMNMGMEMNPNEPLRINSILLRRGNQDFLVDLNSNVAISLGDNHFTYEPDQASFLPDAPRPPMPHTFNYFVQNPEDIESNIQNVGPAALNLRRNNPVRWPNTRDGLPGALTQQPQPQQQQQQQQQPTAAAAARRLSSIPPIYQYEPQLQFYNETQHDPELHPHLLDIAEELHLRHNLSRRATGGPSLPMSGSIHRNNYRSLGDMVHDIIKDAKDLGAMDLAWFAD
ncbi:hypothetical protein J3Q64DRAFT_1870864 [Phycomyces blakesleeanus]|uniref:F-box domain-containing protein n=1 Tax=Phycomyces blakesleeanus TaxID=4837 RepID=A0ABR3AQV0_PHYBL